MAKREDMKKSLTCRIKQTLSGMMLLLLVLVHGAFAQSLNPDLEISQYRHTSWRMQDGSLPALPQAIAQTTDGYIWIGTQDGLMRYDGVRFSRWEPPQSRSLPSRQITTLKADPDGSLWIGTYFGLAHFDHGELHSFKEKQGSIEQIVIDRTGNVWFVRAHLIDSPEAGSLCRVEGTHVKCFGLKEGVPFALSISLAEDAEGFLWLGGDVGVARWKAGASTVYKPSELRSFVNQRGAEALASGRDGSMWVGIMRAGRELGLQNISGGKWRPITAPGFDSRQKRVQALYTDTENSLWVGTMDEGLYRIHDGKVSHFGSSDGLTGDSVYTILEDKEGTLWVITSEGLDRFRAMPVTSYSKRQGLSGAAVRSIWLNRDGSLWIANSGAIDILKNGSITSIRSKDGPPWQVVKCLFQDREGRMWAGIDQDLYRYTDGKFTIIKRPDGKSLGAVQSLAEDSYGDIWAAGYPWYLVRIHDSKVQEKPITESLPPVISVGSDPQNGIWLGFVSGDLGRFQDNKLTVYKEPRPKTPGRTYLLNVVANPDGSVFATYNDGLIKWRNGESRALTEANGLPCSYVGGLITDLKQTLYLDMNCGIVAITRSEMERWWNNPKTKIDLKRFDSSDGVRWGGLKTISSLTARSPDGRLWFADTDVLQVLDPERIPYNRVPPPVVVETMIGNRTGYPVKEGIALPPHLTSLQFDYTALSFAAPQKVLFRYRLDGHDADWQNAGTRRQALYNDLPPGRYRFHVIAANADGVWNREGASLGFSVEPALYQRTWFKVSLAVLACMVLWSLHRLRISILTDQIRERLTERIVERERIARDLHDTLLQGFQSVLLRFQTISKRLVTNPAEQEEMEETISRADEVIAEARDKVWQLRQSSGPSMDVAGYLGSVAEVLQPGSGATFSIVVNGTPRPLLTVALEEIRAVAKEALTNAFQHAKARAIQVEVQYGSSRFEVRICDDGSGMPVDVWERSHHSRHWGLVGIQERTKKLGASVSFAKRPHGGTEVLLVVPASICYIPRSETRFQDFLRRVWPFA